MEKRPLKFTFSAVFVERELAQRTGVKIAGQWCWKEAVYFIDNLVKAKRQLYKLLTVVKLHYQLRW